METGKDVERDWSSLPPELVNLITKHLYDIINFVRFRAVCTAWRLSTPITDLPPQFPWISQGRCNTKKTDLSFFSISSKTIYTIHASKAMNKMLSGDPCSGYYVMKIHKEKSNYVYLRHLSLLNPLNNDEILLPTCDYDMVIWIGHGVNQTGEYIVCCVCSRGDDSEVKFVFCRLGEKCWCELKMNWDFNKSQQYFFLKGMLFITADHTEVTKVIDVTSGTLVYVIPLIRSYLTNLKTYGRYCARFYPVEIFGDIMGVFVGHEPFSSSPLSIGVNRLDTNSSGLSCWLKVKNIGNYAIFMHYLDSFCAVLKANDLTGTKANCIYTLKEKYVRHEESYLHKVVRIDIGTDAKENTRFSLKERGSWFIPNLHHLCPR